MSDIRNSEVSLAIFPFENLTDHNGLEVFCKSFQIDLVTELSRFQQFRIMPFDSLKGGIFSDYSIKGSFRHQDNVLKINAQLVNNHNNHVTWADRFEGDKDSIFCIQEELLKQIVSTLQQQLNHDLLIHIRKKSPVKLTAYEHWLYGMEELKKGTIQADEKARVEFQRAIEIDPTYSLAYSGMSLTYFNEWSCQLWERWDICQREAFTWAKRAIDLNEQNYVAALVLGRVYLYEGEYGIGEHYLRSALRLNPNDTDNLIQLASCFVFLGHLDEAEALYNRVLQLNPLKVRNYHHVGSLIAFEKGQFEKAITLGLSANFPWVDSPGMIAAAYYELGDFDNMRKWWQLYLQEFQKKIANGGTADASQALQWIINVSPYKGESRLLHFWEFIGGKEAATSERKFLKTTPPDKNYFLKEDEIWQVSYEGKLILLSEAKGLHDLLKLLGHPEKQFHCTELMGGGLAMKPELVFDEKAKRSYQKKILELQEEIRWSEDNNDHHRTATLHQEYNNIVDHLSTSLGLRGKIRKTHDVLDKTRSAVTWRIRNIIQKIEKVHPMLAKHLSASVKTGIFCVYNPEKPVRWITGIDFSS
ncbi:MAG TPA: tetratricopeptide repeat protein [Chryseolinea sp.]|nr:tetratricopeptide repeat protein [Chryseolinea sp.]